MTRNEKEHVVRTLRMGDCWPLIEAIYSHLGPSFVLDGCEVGVHRGRTSAELLRTFDNLHLTMVDSWATHDPDSAYWKSGDSCAALTQAQQDANCEAAIEATDFARDRREILRMQSLVASEVCNFSKRSFDFVLIDADHTFDAVRADLRCWWPLVRPGGLICGHDIDHPRDKRGVWGVRRAVEEHMREYRLQLTTQVNCWWMVKP